MSARGFGKSVIHDASALQLLQEHGDITPDLLRIGRAKLLLQRGNDLAEGPPAIATFQYLSARALQLEGAFGKQNHAILLRTAPAASGGKPRLAFIGERRHIR